MLKLHGLDVSGNTYKAQLLLSILKLNYKFIPIDVHNKQHKSEAFLKLNPRGEFPVLEDDAFCIWDSQAILIYLARLHGNNHWYPDTAKELASINQWLSVANGEIFHSLGKARSMLKFGYAGNLQQYQDAGKVILNIINTRLNHTPWLATNTASIADIACYPYVALCEEGNISLQGYPAIHKWFARIEQLDGYIDMPGLMKVKP